MNDLIKLAIDAHGGLDRWRQFYNVSAHLEVGGLLWGMKGHAGVIESVDVKLNLLEQKTSHIPNSAWHTVYTPDRIAIETASGDIVEELYNPRASYQSHAWETKWSNLQLAYFSGYATWNYFNTPFQFARPGFTTIEIKPCEENNETWRRLVVTWPKDIHTHSREQTLYFDGDGLIKRLDYRVEVAGNTACAHYLSDYTNVAGIMVATKRRVYPVDENNHSQLDAPVIVSIDFSDVVFQ
ncbi:hypothetical protein ACX0G7_23980 [Flavitalea antarctica]